MYSLEYSTPITVDIEKSNIDEAQDKDFKIALFDYDRDP